jgi:hypothetical protein
MGFLFFSVSLSFQAKTGKKKHFLVFVFLKRRFLFFCFFMTRIMGYGLVFTFSFFLLSFFLSDVLFFCLRFD